jgi:galacturonosyltransferase
VVRDGENGFLVPAREAPALAAAMERMLALSDDERAQLGRASRALIERSFAEQRVTDAYRAALDDVTRAPV